MSIAERCRATARTFSESLLRSPFSTRTAVLKCASLAALAVAAGAAVSPAVAISSDLLKEIMRKAVNTDIARMTAAIEACNHDEYGSAERRYDLDSDQLSKAGGSVPYKPWYPIPCHPKNPRTTNIRAQPEAVGFTGFYIGADVTGNFNRLGQTETISGTDIVTSQLNDSSRAVGGGVNAGVLFPVMNSPFLIGASGSIDLMRQDTFHTFPGNTFIGQTIDAIGTLNAQIAVVPKQGLLLFGEVGGAVVDIHQKLNFSGPVTWVDQSVTGLNVGIGVAYQPPDWQFAGNPVALVFQANRIFLPDAIFNNPGSPGFAYRNSNDVTTFKGGFRWGLGSPYNIWDTYSGVR
jgi:opacity protein-like surface antigen